MGKAETAGVDIDTQDRTAELAEKQSRLQQFMEEQGLDAVVLSRHENIAWATAGLVDIRVGVLRETGIASLLFNRNGKAFYLSTNNEAPRLAAEEFPQLDYEPLIQPWYANDVMASIAKVVGGGNVAADAPLGVLPVLALQPLRFELTPTEIERYRWLGAHTAAAVTQVLLGLRPGMSETMMQAKLAEQLILRQIMPSVYLTAVDDRVRKYRHAVPRAGVLEHYGMVNFCSRRWGLAISMTRFVHFGPMPDELTEKFAAVAVVNAKILHATRGGKSADELFAVAREAYVAAGYAGEERMHHQGGATGYAEREWVARPGGQEQVLNNQAFAWNPSLQGAKAEDTALLQDGTIETITLTPELPTVKTILGGIEYRSAGVLAG
jgi:Xaa-Pro dipeptidase